jgi:hypothetical protein
MGQWVCLLRLAVLLEVIMVRIARVTVVWIDPRLKVSVVGSGRRARIHEISSQVHARLGHHVREFVDIELTILLKICLLVTGQSPRGNCLALIVQVPHGDACMMLQPCHLLADLDL